ncbi:hypothetical protein J8L88_16860 [Aquimarina sp. MMG015]|uniref:hypothetical protein n=1 Tax=Aquimarina sp. MMG015 TaxID=2822689 RepID=UPI001B39E7F8|nr:hypothetical protein [Aquimarina sp. MMG015]MBQ4804534.1 hypothetical protein [Aquimarina sp. MMG015]
MYTIYEKVKLGDIYKTGFDERPFRIIGFDDYEVFYDCLWSDKNWTFSDNFRVKTIFYRMSLEIFKNKSKLIENLPLTEKELQYFRPDLPMRFGRTKNVNWNSFDSSEIENLKSEFGNQKFNATKIVVVPFGPKGGLKKGEILENKSEWTEFDIIQKAKKIQESATERKSNGIGFYRLGYEKGLPRYSIGEYFDRAGIMKK